MVHAYVEIQKFALMGHGGWVKEGYRAVCDGVPHGEPLAPPHLMQTWMADGPPHEDWIHAKLDAIQHDLEMHLNARSALIWEEVVAG